MSKKPYRRGMVALSADPIHFGHLDLFCKSAAQCRELVVLVANNVSKNYVFNLSERTAMTERAVKDAGTPNVRVIGSGGLLVDAYLREDCDVIFRGVRNEKDFSDEEELADLNRIILPSVVVRYIDADPRLRRVSSSNTKAFVTLNADIDKFVPMFVKQAIEEKMRGQRRLGVTGRVATGKSWVAAELVRQAQAAGQEATHINVDELLRDLYDEDSPGAQAVRIAIGGHVGPGTLSADRKRVDRGRLAALLFRIGEEAARKREFVTKLTMPHVARKYREKLADAKGLVVVEWAQLAEMDMGPWVNNNVVVVDSPDRETFLERRGYDAARVAVMDEIQLSAGRKCARLLKRAARDGSGKVLRYENRIRKDPREAEFDVAGLYREVMESYKKPF